MKYSKLFGKSSKTEGSDLQADSHRLLVQAGYIRESTAGRYFMLPLGIRVHDNIQKVIKKRMDAAGGQELITPTLHPLELWKETNRDNAAGFELSTLEDRRGAQFALGGTAEEMVVDLVRKFNISYKDLPFNVYQFSLKFRDELRARGGLLRVREFVMKDAYSFSTEAQFESEYNLMRDTYSNIFKDLGLDTAVAEADGGYIGGDYCHEFIADSDVGESDYFVEEDGDYVAHEDVAEFTPDMKNTQDELAEMTKTEAVRGTTMEDGASAHDMPLWQQIKDVLYVDEDNDQYVLAVIRGDYDVNDTKLKRALKTHNLRAATEEEIRQDLGTEPGFISPVGIVLEGKSGRKLLRVGDPSLRTVVNAYGGANELNQDYLNMNIERDYDLDIETDIAMCQDGFESKSGHKLVAKKGIEVGNIFQLGYQYTNAMKGADYTDEDGVRKPYYMGCYGIGVGRTMAAIVETHNDENGISWPMSVAPYHVYMVTISEDEQVLTKAQELYDQLKTVGIEILYDDRKARPGEKLSNADLVGMPIRVVISPRSLENGEVECKIRTESDSQNIAVSDVVEHIQNIVKRG